MVQALCESCLERFDDGGPAGVGGRRLCPGCRGRLAPAGVAAAVPIARVVEPPVSPFVRLRDRADAWCAGRSGAVRLPLLVWFAYILVRHWADEGYHSLFFGLNLGIHELGHPLFIWLGEFLGVAGGTILQCLVPVLSMGMFYRQGDFFGIAACFGWLSTNLFYCGWYAADAVTVAIPLANPFGRAELLHDWNYLLGAMGLLPWTGTIAFLFRLAASFAMLAGLALGGWLVWRMFRARDAMPPAA